MKIELVDELLGNLKNMVDILQSVSDNGKERKGNYDAEAGEIKTPVKKKRGRPKKKKESEPKMDEDFIVNKQKESRTPKFIYNKFEDMQGLDVDKPQGYDKIDDKVRASTRSRKKYVPLSIKCSECGVVAKINPVFKKDNFICDKCVGNKFGR